MYLTFASKYNSQFIDIYCVFSKRVIETNRIVLYKYKYLFDINSRLDKKLRNYQCEATLFI